MTTTPTPSPDAVEALARTVMTELKPCPFCGGEAVLIVWPSARFVKCKVCAASSDDSNGVHKWNTRAEPAPLPDDVGIDYLIEQLDMGEPDPSDYEVVKHLFDAQDRHRAAMSNIKVRLLCIKSLRANISALEAENKRLRDLLECWDGVANSHEPTGHKKDCGCLRCDTQAALTQPEPQKCGTCGGRGWLPVYEGDAEKCPDCNGTGKAGA